MKYLRLFTDNYTKPEDITFDSYVSYSETPDTVHWDGSEYIEVNHLTNTSDSYIKIDQNVRLQDIDLVFDTTATSGTLFSSQNISLSIIGSRTLKFTYQDQSQEFDIPKEYGNIINIFMNDSEMYIMDWDTFDQTDISRTIEQWNPYEDINPLYLFSNGTNDFFKGSIQLTVSRGTYTHKLMSWVAVKRRSDNKLGVWYNDVFYTSPNSDFTQDPNIEF